MRWAGHIAPVGDRRSSQRVLVVRSEDLKKRDHLEDLRVNGRIIMK